jgi:hypothetical protein
MALAGGRRVRQAKGNAAVSDIFQQVDEEVRREQLRKLWERYGSLLIAACVLIVVAAAGWRTYEWYQAKQAAEASAKFEAAVALVNEGKNKEAEEAFGQIAAGSTPSYRMLAKFREAAELARREPKAAAGLYDQLAADSSIGRVLQDLAAVRAAAILVDTEPYGELAKRLEPLTLPDRAFRHSARALLALSAWRNNDATAMRKWSEMILGDPETPAGTRGQIQVLMALSDTDKKS